MSRRPSGRATSARSSRPRAAVRVARVRTVPRALAPVLALVAACLGGALAPAPAAAQMVGVPLAPARPAPAAPAPTVAGRDSAATPTAARRDTVEERQRLDIQAWVDSAAGALSQSNPTPVPAAAPATTGPAPRTPAARPRRQPARPSAETRRKP